jgi:hypothetical protein
LNGNATAVFQVVTNAVSVSSVLTLTATNSVSSQTYSLTVVPASLLSIALAKTTIGSGGGTYGSVYLNANAALARVINLTSDDPTHVILTPSVVTIPAGKNSMSFVVNVKAGTVAETVHLTATDPVSGKTVQIAIAVGS